ncbi:MAG TPA: transglycosylase SLT domain-containing protein [Candidatus Limnocylindrales bacterium]|nr:transglycosylase SLT domain-containing protein [Candidatus Limnocylindrales bacterium]
MKPVWRPGPIVSIVPPPRTEVRTAEPRAEVRFFLERFQTGYRKAVVERWLARSGRYGEMIRDVLVQRGMPEELIFTAMIESGFDPLAASRAGARGIWQFMAATARRYGLRVDRWLDERLDPEKSTLAAARYLGDLYSMFGSWPLVQAAYNTGETRVMRAIQAMRTNDFWLLSRTPHLADETKNFVAAIEAARLIGREPARYGFTVALDEAVRYDVVRVPAGTSLPHLASRSGVAKSELLRLNPELRMPQTPPGMDYALKVPVGTTGHVQAALRPHAPTERSVASREAPAVTTLQAVGRAPARAPVFVKTPVARAPQVARAAAPPHVHVVKPRETVGSIARRYGVPATEIARLNRLGESDRIFPGDRLRVAALARAEPSTSTTEGGSGGFR